jgi:hypothetical protein
MLGAGPLSESGRVGALLHLLHAFTPDGTPLGAVHAAAWTRPATPPRRQSLTQAERWATLPEEKENYRWVVALREAPAEAQCQPQTRIVCVADSEADIYELLAEGAVAALKLLCRWHPRWHERGSPRPQSRGRIEALVLRNNAGTGIRVLHGLAVAEATRRHIGNAAKSV